MSIILSIIVPMFNCAKFLDKLFSSITPGLIPEFEFIFINDGSTDDTYKLCIEYANDSNNVKVINNSNNGVSYSRNVGIKFAQGQYIMFVDADDILTNNWVETVKAAIQIDAKPDVIFFGRGIKESITKKELIETIIGTKKQTRDSFLGAPWSKLFRRNFLIKNDIEFNKNIIHGEDALFNIKSILLADNYFIVNESIYKYYINNSSATHRFDSRFLSSNERYLIEVERLLKMHSDYPQNTISNWVDYSFVNSLYILAGKFSKITPAKPRLEAVREFYSRDYYMKRIQSVKMPNSIAVQNRVVFYIVKFRLFALFELILPLLRRNSSVGCSEWFEI